MEAELYERYSRQILFGPLGEEGQKRLLETRAVVVGCGALGTVLAGLLVRAGVGGLRVVDRDFVELSNLQRQTLFAEADAREALPKAVAAERRLRAMNSGVAVEGVVADVTPENIGELAGGFPLILDGTDNFETRMLLNDYAVSAGVPWIYAAAVGSYGVTFTVRPGETACLACLVETAGDGNAAAGLAGEETCDTAGVLNTAAGVIGALEAAEAVKILSGHAEALAGRLISCDVWKGRFQAVRVEREPGCRACGRREFRWLKGEAQPQVTMCGRDSVQIHERRRRLDLEELARRLAGVASGVRTNGFLLRFAAAGCEVTVFADGRAVVKGTKDAAVARSIYARYIGA
ncbi:MAG TPA: ThiF family adenylyltransferase [Candidatus Acidoferrales bacterium]|nr:ThiF family adenylyltransferase [Candidatus Acidoferrales bacterium]